METDRSAAVGTAPQAELAPGDGGDGSAPGQQAQEDHALAALSLELQTMMLETVAEPHSRSSSQQQQQVCTPSTPSAGQAPPATGIVPVTRSE